MNLKKTFNTTIGWIACTNMPPHFHTIGYADDLAVVVIALNKQGNTVLQEVNSWLAYHKLRLAREKTEVIVMAGRKVLSTIFFTVENTII